MQMGMVMPGCTAGNVTKYGVSFGPYFPKFGPEKTPYLDTFHAVMPMSI